MIKAWLFREIPDVPVDEAVIGDRCEGGYYAGQISTAGNEIADYHLIVSPKVGGQAALVWDSGAHGALSTTSVIDGPTNSATEAAHSANLQAATFCEGLTIGGKTDWYLPALNELEVLYYYFKPTTQANDTGYGSNANAVAPEPVSTVYSAGAPAQTTVASFIAGGINAFPTDDDHWSSTETDATTSSYIAFLNGISLAQNKTNTCYVRAVRRVAV